MIIFEKKKNGWWIFKLLVYKMCVGCILEIVLFKVCFWRDILMEIVFNVDYWYLLVLNFIKWVYLVG